MKLRLNTLGAAGPLPDFARHPDRPRSMIESIVSSGSSTWPPPYRRLKPSTATTTVDQLWDEWTKSTLHRPSVEEMNRRYGELKWLEDEPSKKFYRKRRAIISAVRESPLFSEDFPQNALWAVQGEMGKRSINAYGNELIANKQT